jgi:hypothetical protein
MLCLLIKEQLKQIQQTNKQKNFKKINNEYKIVQIISV